MKLFSCLLLPFVPLLASCDRAAIEPSQSLVGAKELPTSRELSRETIEINRGFGGDGFGSHLLSYELRPDNGLTVRHIDRSNFEKGEAIRGKETFRLSPEMARDARYVLSRIRPQKLEGVEYETRPAGCEQQWDHDFGEAAVVFIREGGKAGIEDDQVGVFVLPEPESCNNRQAQQATSLISRLLESFPQSKVAERFRRMQAEWES